MALKIKSPIWLVIVITIIAGTIIQWCANIPAKYAKTNPKTLPRTIPPIDPSIVFLGDNLGINLCLPKAIPAK